MADPDDIEAMTLTPPPEPEAEPGAAPSGATPGRSDIYTKSNLVDISSLPTAGAIARGTLREWLFNGVDTKIEQVRCMVQWESSTTQDYARRTPVRGRWFVSLIQEDQPDRETTNLTVPVEVRNPRGEPFLLGSTAGRIRDSRPVYLQLEYEAASGAGSEPVFWDSAISLQVSTTLTV